MTKLTKEQLFEKLQHRIAVAAKYPDLEEAQLDAEIFKIALASLEAEPVGEFYHEKQGGWYQISEGDKVSDNRRTPLYAAPVLPKQPDNLDELMNAVEEVLRISDRDHDAWDRARAAMADIRNGVEAPAQPVIPEQPEFYTKPDLFLPECLKPEEISGGRRNSRIAELMGWFDRYYSGKANPKWLKAHVAELCYYILTVPQLSAQPVSEPYKLPQGYALVPCKLTAENGAKSCMIGKFIEQTEISCPECFGDDECETCDGSGTIEVTAHVSWTTIKDIWAKGIEHFAAAPTQESE